MQIIQGKAVYSLSDLLADQECKHLTLLEQRVALQELAVPERDAASMLLARKGTEHEERFLQKLQAQSQGAIVDLARKRAPESSYEEMLASDLATQRAMATGAEIIYQPTFFDGMLLSRADFLRRVNAPSEHWAWSYEVIDTKLAVNLKANYILQLCHYQEEVARLQGSHARFGYVILGNGTEYRLELAQYMAYFRRCKTGFITRAAAPRPPSYPQETRHCAVCRWAQRCDTQRDSDDHLSLVANIRHDHIQRLQHVNIHTLQDLAASGEDQRPRGIAQATFAVLRAQALLQHRSRTHTDPGSPPHRYELLDPVDGQGFAQLPVPNAGDVFFDIEGDPMYAPEHGLEYLFGFMIPTTGEYRAFWALSEAQERTTFEAVIDFIVQQRSLYPDMHIYHYAPYEITAFKRLAGRYGTRERELDGLLRQQVFIDLYAVVRQTIRISQPSYSIKKLEPFYGMQRRTDVRRGDDSIVQFELWLTTGDNSILEDIERYNDDDCRSTMLLHQWLLERKRELESNHGRELPWRADPELPEMEAVEADAQSNLHLLEGIEAPKTLADLRSMADEQRARWILANLLGYHKRDEKPEWWKYYSRLENRDGLIDGDSEALGGLVYDADIPAYLNAPKDRRFTYTFTFPVQHHAIGLGLQRSADFPGKTLTVIAIHAETQTIKIKLGQEIAPHALHSVIPRESPQTGLQQKALKRLAELVVREKFGQKSAALDILLTQTTRLNPPYTETHIQPKEITSKAILDVVLALDQSYLVIQGPPGTGKTHHAGFVIAELLAKGKSVGILSKSHKAVHNLLHKVEEVASARSQSFVGFQKYTSNSDDSKYDSFSGMITPIADIKKLTADHTLLGGTAWVFSAEALTARYDYLFIDEAGQLSLADALACAGAARNVVLLGDPLQLAHVSPGTHPIGSGPSVLAHLLGAEQTVSPERGIFLDISYRMSTPICTFISDMVYEQRLKPWSGVTTNAIHSPGLQGNGLRHLSCAHEANSRESFEEAEQILAEIRQLLQGSVTLGNAPARPLTQSDILVVTPYNAQRKVIKQKFAQAGLGDIQIGTVDKFQGLEAPVVFYSMATSSGEDVARGLEFLFEINRLNVALSRAQCLAVLVCSPKLLDIRCSTPEQIRLVSVLCEFIERSKEYV